MKAVVMAGGFGTRLRPLTCNLPKPLVPLANRPIMEHILTLLKQHGFEDVVVMLYYHPELIQSYFGDGSKMGLKIVYLRPDRDLGTAGCVKFASQYLNETFLVISADLLTDFDLTQAISFHREKKSVATMVLTSVDNPLQYGIVITDAAGNIVRFLEKPAWGEVFSDTINTGIYVLEPEVLDLIPTDREFDFSRGLFPGILEKKMSFYGYIARGSWRDIGTLDEYRLANLSVLDNQTQVKIVGRKTEFNDIPVWVGEGTEINPEVEFTAPTILGKNVKLGRRSKIGRSIIGDNTVIGEDSTIYVSIIWNNAQLGNNIRVSESIIGSRTEVRNYVELRTRSVVSDDCVIGEAARVESNVKIWPKKVIEDGAVLSSSLIWGEKWTKYLFGAYGITGLGNIEITPEFATKVGAAYGAYVGKNKYILTSRDAHPASRMIKRSMIAGLISAGVKVGDLRTAPIPVVRYELGKEGEAGGLHVRQSPYDPRMMDIKFFDSNGSEIAIHQEKAIEQLFLREDYPRVAPEDVGEIVLPARPYEFYQQGFLKTVNREVIKKSSVRRTRPFKIVIDYSYSAAAQIFPAVLGELNCEIVSLNAFVDSRKTTKSEWEFRHYLEQLADIVVTLKADAGFLIDTGAEKVFIVDDRGKIIPDQLALVLVARLAMECYESGTIAVPVNITQVMEELTEHNGKQIHRTRTLPRYIMDAAREKGTIFVGDGIGGYIFPEFQPAFDAMYAIAKIIEMLAQTDVSLSRLGREIPDFKVEHRKVPCPWNKKGLIMRELISEVKGKKAEFVDGVRIIFDRAWTLLLPDPDEAYFHIWVEAERDTKAQELLNKYTSKIQTWLK